MFRHRPAELFFNEAQKKNVGIIARVPLASGLLSGKFNANTSFQKEDHRNFNINGEAFDQGETFSGVDYDLGLTVVDKIKSLFPNNIALVNLALRWILMFPEVSCVIPGVSKVEQLFSNLKTLKTAELNPSEMKEIQSLYNEFIRPSVHHRW